MDIHRSRFVEHNSSPINALAFSRSSDKNLTDPKPALKLALGRANGDIEIWSGDKGAWVQEVVFPAGDDRSVDALAWIQEPDEADSEGRTILGQMRLFSIGSTPAVTEWNLATGRVERASTGNFSEVWCFAAQPRWRQTKDKTTSTSASSASSTDSEFRGQNLVVGCGDGSLALLSTADNDLVFQRFLSRSASRKARCMSLAWQSRTTVVAGFTDSTIRVFDARNGSMLRNMSLGAGIPGAPRDALVWRIKCLPDGTIVSADSNGEVKIWDARTYSLSQRLTGHESDCLDLVTSTDGQTIFSGGMDGRVAVYKLGTKEGEKRGRWAKVSHRRMHNGDIKAMAIYDSKHMSVVVSGGLDTTPVVTPVRNFGKELHRRLPGLPQTPICTSAPAQRLLGTWEDRDISLWRINKQHTDRISPTPDGTRKLVARIAIKGDDAITSAALSDDGSLLVAATLKSVKVFHLRPTADVLDDRLRVRKVNLPNALDTLGARLVAFSPDRQWLSIVSPDSEIHVARLEHQTRDAASKHPVDFLPKIVELERPTRKTTKQTGLKKYERTITRLAFSPDSAVLVASDISGYLDSWVLEGRFDETAPATDTAKSPISPSSEDASSDEDSDSDDSDDDDENVIFYGQHWADNPSGNLLPKLDSSPLLLSFRPFATKPSEPVHGNPGIHATRNNPHAHSHALPNTKSPLFIITAQHQVYEFDVLAGKLTDWSRRNPTSVMPAEFLSIKDRVMGAVWDVDDSRARTWLYGSNWVGMLDLSQDYEASSSSSSSAAEDVLENGDVESNYQTPGRKRKRRESANGKWEKILEQRKRTKGASGAGDKVSSAERNDGADEVRTILEDGSKIVNVARDHNNEKDGDDDDDDEEDDDDDVAAGPLRRTAANDDDDDDDDEAMASSKDQRRNWWCTYRYRPILAMVPIAERAKQDGDDDNLQEVVLVERPLWDLPQMKELAKVAAA